MTHKVACLGAGFFSQFHLDGWHRLPDAQIVGVADNDLGKARSTGHPAFLSLEDMLTATTPDILDIIVPPTAHAEAIKVALAHGVPGDGQGPDAYLARQPYFQTMPRFMFHETGVHYADTFRFLFGDPTAVYADLRKINPVIAGEDAGIVTFDHPGGVRTILDANRNADHCATNMRCTMGEGLFEGTEGSLTLTGDGAVHLRRFGETTPTTILPPDTSPCFGGDCTYLLQAHVLRAISTHGHIENIAEDYLTVLQVEESVYQSSRDGKKVNMDGRP